MKVSPIIILAIVAIVIFIIGLGLSGLGSEAPPEEVNDTEKVQDEVPEVKEEQKEEQPPFIPESKCGDGTCDADERCDPATNETICFEDCNYLCPPVVIIHSSADATKTELNSYYCGDEENCAQTDEDNFIITANTSIRTRITNLGERYSAEMAAQFICKSGDPFFKATGDDHPIRGLIVRDYFGDHKESAGVNSKPTGDNSVEYVMEFDFTEEAQLFNMDCSITLRSLDILNSQVIFIGVRP